MKWIVFSLFLLGAFVCFLMTSPLGFALPEIISPIFILISAFLYGKLILREERSVDIPIALGLVIVYFLSFLIGIFKLYYALPLAVLVLLPFVKPNFRKTDLHLHWGLLLTLPSLLLVLPFSLLPPVFYDDLVYHLGTPNYYLIHHGIVFFPSHFYSNLPVLQATIFSPLLKFFGSPQFFNLLTLSITGYSIFLLSKDFGLEGWIAALLAISMPMSVFLASTSKDDLLVAFFITTGTRAFFKWRDGKLPIYIPGMIFGAAISTKYTALIALTIFILLLLVMNKIKLRQAIIISVIAGGVFLPILAKNTVMTGNPIYPYIIGGKDMPIERLRIVKRDVGGRISFYPEFLKKLAIGIGEGSGGIIGPVLFFLPFLLLIKIDWRLKFITLFSLIFLLISPLFTRNLRFSYFAIALLMIPTEAVIEYFLKGGLKGAVLFILIPVQFFVSFSLLTLITNSGKFLSWKESEENYLSKMVPPYTAYQYINKAKGIKKVLIIGEQRSYYLKKPFAISSIFTTPYTKGKNKIELKKEGFTHVLFCPGEFQRLEGIYRIYGNDTGRVLKIIQSLKLKKHLGPCALFSLR